MKPRSSRRQAGQPPPEQPQPPPHSQPSPPPPPQPLDHGSWRRQQPPPPPPPPNNDPNSPQPTGTDALTDATSMTPAAGPSGPSSSNSTTSGSGVGQSSGNASVSSMTQSEPWNSSTHSLSGSTTRSQPWTYSATVSKTSSGAAATETSYVPGIVFNLTLTGGDSDEAVYALPMSFGHEVNTDDSRKRGTETSAQILNMLIDLGSSDTWVASINCDTKDCKSAPVLFDDTLSVHSGTDVPLEYHVGSVEGEIIWEQVTAGNFGIGYQAIVAAETVQNENLGSGNFSGLLGLALPASSQITKMIPGTTGSSPDGATFLDNLFGAGASAPTQRLFSLSLGRADDTRTYSTFGIGETFEPLCPSPCSPNFMKIIPQPNLGRTGYLHWRIPVEDVKFTTWDNDREGTGPTTKSISLGRTGTDAKSSTPLGVLDSGGVAILVSNRTLLDSIYGAYGINASSDGLYRLPCTKQLAYTFTLGGQDFPVHPLDMSWIDVGDISFQTCIGAFQYAGGLGNAGDFILGSSFLKNAYSVFQYPDQKKNPSTWQPRVGLVPLTDPAKASRDFYAVRNLRQTLGSVSTNGGNTQGGPSGETQHRVVSTAVIAACSVVGFFVLVAIAFCAWWFWLRRRLGSSGVVEYKMAAVDHDSNSDTVRTRSYKHVSTQRQKSMVEGYSDVDVNSWRSASDQSTLRYGNQPMIPEEHELHRMGDAERRSNHTRGSSLHQSLMATESPALIDFGPEMASGHKASPSTATEDLTRERTRSSGAPLLRTPGSTHARLDSTSGTYSPEASSRYPSLTPSSISMQGPFPTPNRASRSDFGYFPMFQEGANLSVSPTRPPNDRRASRSSIQTARTSNAPFPSPPEHPSDT